MPALALDESAPDHSAISRTAIEDVEQQGCSSAGSTTRVNKMLAPFFG